MLFVFPFVSNAQSEKPKKVDKKTIVIPKMKVTGIVVVPKNYKLPNSAIINDKIWWQGDTYLVENGKIKYRIIIGGRVKIDINKLMKLVKVEKGKVTLSYKGKTIVKKIRV